MPKAFKTFLRQLRPRPAHRRTFQGSHVDLLETRVLPTAVVSFTGTLLKITGDTNSNEVLVERSGNQLHVAGQNGTLINVLGTDLPEFFFTLTNSFNLTAKFSGGDDVLDIRNELQLRSVNIAMGDGENSVTISEAYLTGKLTITTGAGDDCISLFQTSVTSNTLINTGGEDDDIYINECILIGSTTIKTDVGGDFVSIGNNESSGRVKCVGKLTILTGDDCDEVRLDKVESKAFLIDTGNGDDKVRINDVLMYGIATVKTGAGEDCVRVDTLLQSASGTNLFDLAADTDSMSMFNCTFAAAATINLGSGTENSCTIDDTTFHGVFTLKSQGTDDEIVIENNLGGAGATTFNRAAKFFLGLSNIVTLGVDDAASSTRFLASSTFRGQIPTSTLFVTVARVSFFSPPVLTNVTPVYV